MNSILLAAALLVQNAWSQITIPVGTASILPDANVNSTLPTAVNGQVQFWQKSAMDEIIIDILIKGLRPGSRHGMHIHGAPVQGQNCTTAASHWNPLNSTHGAPSNTPDKRHFGDLGNFEANAQGIVQVRIRDKLISFFGNNSIKDNALTFVVHEKQDDLGLGGNADSLKTGNCGSRLSCGVIRTQTLTLNYTEPSANTTNTSTNTNTTNSLSGSTSSLAANPNTGAGSSGSGLYPAQYQVPTTPGSSPNAMESSQPLYYSILSSARSMKEVTGAGLVAVASFALLLC
jgi:Cu-Zn family superoxide dismutase